MINPLLNFLYDSIILIEMFTKRFKTNINYNRLILEFEHYLITNILYYSDIKI